MEPFDLSQLNSEQRRAAEHNSGPLLIVAGAGTGKTRTLTYRIAQLITDGVEPSSILAITFTNKAAAEMQERTTALLENLSGYHPDHENPPMIKTFHSLGSWLLRRHADRLGLPKSFSIFDSSDQLQILKTIMSDLGFDPKEHDPRVVRSIISKQRTSLNSPGQLATAPNPALKRAANIWERYEAAKKQQGGVDFDDLLILPYELLSKHDDLRERYQKAWQYIHVDEYQDTNVIQYKLAELLSAEHHNLCVVGDGDQTIYSWRGADVRNILRFEKDFPGATVIMLEDNYRSTPTILEAAQQIIEKNNARIPKVLRANIPDGPKVQIYNAANEYDEARFVTNTISQVVREKGYSYSDVAILFRTNFQSRILEEACLKADLPYQVVGTRFFERKEVKDIVAYLQYLVNREHTAALVRIINNPKRGLGQASVTHIISGHAHELSPRAQKQYQGFLDLINAINEYSNEHTLAETIVYILKKSGYEEMLSAGSADEQERLENLKELVSYATRFDDLTAAEALPIMLEGVTLMSDQDTMADAANGLVRLMTIHAAKGLEFSVVFIVGMEQGLFPSGGSNDDRDREEERRLCYVAFTRAKKELYLSYATLRRIYGKTSLQMPSEFLSDLSDDIIEEQSTPTTATGGGGLLDDPLDTITLDW